MRPLLVLLALLVAGCAGGSPTLGPPGGATPTPTTPAEAGVPDRVTYGPDPSQFVEVGLPEGPATDLPVLVLLHGGFWRAQYGLDLMTGLADVARARGWATVNVEYRRVGGGGGWPATFEDVAAAVDLVAELDAPLDLDRVAVVGHSAGGHLAAWAASRPSLPDGAPGADPTVVPCAAVSQAGVVDLTAAGSRGVGSGAAAELLGGTPDEVPDRYALADPLRLVPPAAPVLLVHGESDTVVPRAQSEAYAAAAGGQAELRVVPGDHFTVIDPADPSWPATLDWLEGTC